MTRLRRSRLQVVRSKVNSEPTGRVINPQSTQPLVARALLRPTTTMSKKRDPVNLHAPATLRELADEADGQRHQTAFGHLDETALLRTMAAALRAYANAQEDREPPQRDESADEHAPAA
jgi:hypothetical protein